MTRREMSQARRRAQFALVILVMGVIERWHAELDRRWRIVKSTKDSGMETLDKVIIAGVTVAIALAAGLLLWNAFTKHSGPLK